jgi:hypothetical protein
MEGGRSDGRRGEAALAARSGTRRADREVNERTAAAGGCPIRRSLRPFPARRLKAQGVPGWAGPIQLGFLSLSFCFFCKFKNIW